jgi:lysophospholipase L1-like esterase
MTMSFRPPRTDSVSRYVALGDSFSAANSEAGEIGWAHVLGTALRAVNPKVSCHNLARVGATSGDVAERQVPHALTLQPDLVTLSCGVDEILAATGFDLGTFAGHVSVALRTLRRERPETTVVTVTYPDFVRLLTLPRASKAALGSALRQVNGAIRSLARRHGIVCVELALDRSISIDASSPAEIWRRQNSLLVDAVVNLVAPTRRGVVGLSPSASAHGR